MLDGQCDLTFSKTLLTFKEKCDHAIRSVVLFKIEKIKIVSRYLFVKLNFNL